MSNRPQYILFANARGGPNRHWRFELQTVDGRTCLQAEDGERDAADERLHLLAVVRGLEAIDSPARVRLVTDSRYVRRGLLGLEVWRPFRRSRAWSARLTALPHADLWHRIERAARVHELECERLELPRRVAEATIPAGEAHVA
jgi:ribonuclease HI